MLHLRHRIVLACIPNCGKKTLVISLSRFNPVYFSLMDANFWFIEWLFGFLSFIWLINWSYTPYRQRVSAICGILPKIPCFTASRYRGIFVVPHHTCCYTGPLLFHTWATPPSYYNIVRRDDPCMKRVHVLCLIAL